MRAEARALGAAHYFTGEPCKFGHVAKRIVRNGSCYECFRIADNRRRRERRSQMSLDIARRSRAKPSRVPPPHVAQSDFLKPLTRDQLMGRK